MADMTPTEAPAGPAIAMEVEVTRYADGLAYARRRVYTEKQIAAATLDPDDIAAVAARSLEQEVESVIATPPQPDVADSAPAERPGVPREPREMPGLYVVFDGPPGPQSGHFVEVEDETGRSVRAAEWRQEGPWWTLGPFRSVLDASPERCPTCGVSRWSHTGFGGEPISDARWAEEIKACAHGRAILGPVTDAQADRLLAALTTWHCDRCDDEATGGLRLPAAWKRIRVEGEGMDLCPICALSLARWLEAR